jgi:hypothetical protein
MVTITPETPAAERRTARTVLLVLLGVAIGGAAILGFFLLTDTTARSDDATMGQTSTMAGGTSVEDVLRMHIPPEILDTCHVQDEHNVESLAYTSLVCSPGSSVETLQYSTFHDALAIRFEFKTDAKTARIPEDAGDCSETPPGSGRWWGAAADDTMGTGGEVMHDVQKTASHMPGGTTGGRYMCYRDGGLVWIEWYDGDTHIYGWAAASQDAYPQLYNWWVNQAGPFHPRMTATMPDGSTDSSSGSTAPPPSDSPTSSGSMDPMEG